ncbi:MAG: hypothetical protein Tsb002_14190 [Wenzhouxiangellaceae bacterium]
MRYAGILIGLLFSAPVWCAGHGDWLQQFADDFHHIAVEDNIPGAAYAVVNRDRLLAVDTYGYARRDLGQTISPDTLFRVASVSKTFAAGLTALLVADGQLSWDEPVTRYASDFRIQGPTEAIQLRHLLSHSTGLPAYAYDNFIEEGLPFADIVEKFTQLSPICQPGECYTYQNSAFSLIQPALENVTATRYAELMRQRIFEPLDMRTASVGYDAFVANSDHAQPHVKRKGNWQQTLVLPNYYRVAPAAGVNASILDLSKWLMAQLGSHPEVISPEIIASVTRPQVRTSRDLRRKRWRDHLQNAHYGLGWRVYDFDGHRLIYHGGWVSGFRTDVAYAPDFGIGLAVAMNAEGSTVTELTTRFWATALPALSQAREAQRYTASSATDNATAEASEAAVTAPESPKIPD